ncbi:DsbC family protein [Burkholderiaceae bacterium DAT-1]|nr:DsbC family protein [Burkholderiaceae bacterium DAT-1]
MNVSFPLSRTVLALATVLTFAACANAANETESVKSAVQKKLPQRKIESVRPSPVKGVFEVVIAPRQVVYTDAKADFMFVGDMVDLKRQVSLTEERMNELMKTDFNKLPFESAIKVVKGNGSRRVAVFSDPDCPFCKKLEQETLSKLDNVTIYNFVFPIASLHPDAARKSALIWCAEDKLVAWNNWMFNGTLPDNKGDCAHPISALQKVGEDIGVNATPTIVFENGQIIPGAIDSATFETQLSMGKKS